ncbi:hypothetical protein DE146DRAFT_787730 [Phaeosphaeria sp. MPI-PUGE-AT-0046c]|nr:hypothetical protein DE146DRAFT_787730 [Phaeosphaeria sp. MPI-PUGE-AT-0046c]
MQNYGQPPRPGSVTSFAGQQQQQQQAPPPTAYGGYQQNPPPNQGQWPAQAQHHGQGQQWNQPQQQAVGGYNPGTYGAMPGGQQVVHAYPPQQHDQPPPPPPKPYGFAGAIQQQQQQQQQNQVWQQQPQHDTGHTPQQQGGYPVQGGTQGPQQPYNKEAPPPPSATPGGSYFPPTQGGRPGSVYGANYNAQNVTPQSSTVMSPNEQQPAYIPPSLTGQGVQAYMPSNTNPMPGVYVPPPPDVPAWQQAQHAPLQGGQKKFRYTKPTVDPSFYAQGYQGVQQPQAPALPPHPVQYTQAPVAAHPQQPPGPPPPLDDHISHGQASQQQPQFLPQQQPYGQAFEQPAQPSQQPAHQSPYNVAPQYEQARPPGDYTQQPTRPPTASNVSKPYNQWEAPAPRPDESQLYGASNVSKPYNQWDVAPPAPQGFAYAQHEPNATPAGQQPQWKPGHHHPQVSQSSISDTQHAHVASQDIQAPKPLVRTDTASSNFYTQSSPENHPVSPIHNRQSMSFNPGQLSGLGRNGSVSSIAVTLQAQREGNRTSSPRPAPPKLPTPPPPRDDKSKFSALGMGGPSDWEHFGADAEIDDEEIFAKKSTPAQLDSVELPASQPELSSGPSPPSTQGWPSPATHSAASMSAGRKDTYQPTPPPVVAQLAERPSSTSTQQTFVMGDVAPAPLSISPKPIQGSRPASTQQQLDLSDGTWQRPKQQTPNQQNMQFQQPQAQQSLVTNDGGWAAQSQHHEERNQTPSQQVRQPPSVAAGFVMDEGGMPTSQRTPTQESNIWGPGLVEKYAADLKAKDEAFERLHTDTEKEIVNLRAELEKLKADKEFAAKQTINEKKILQDQVTALELAAEQAKTCTEAALKEKDMMIERMKEDAEGKDHNIEERDVIVANLRHELETEKSKEPVKATPVPRDLIPDIDPWYAGSLQRYIAMLRAEATEPLVEDKIKTFREFLKAEAGIRGIEPYEGPVQVAEPAGTAPAQAPAPITPGASNPVADKTDLSVQVPETGHNSSDDEDFQYSPGGRPLLARQATIPTANAPVQQQQHPTSAQSTAILTPTSSVDDDSNKTPVQSPPEEQTQPIYKAYVPPVSVASFSNESAPATHRNTISNVSAPFMPLGTGKRQDEIFFGAHEPSVPAGSSGPTSRDSVVPDAAVPAPLAFASNRSMSSAPSSKKDPAEMLTDLLPHQVGGVKPNHLIEEASNKLSQLEKGADIMEDLTKKWETAATATRKKNDSARRKRQEENEEVNDEAFNNEEISYADLNELEDEFKQKENALKVKEDRDEYASYVEAVFDPVYDALQAEIKDLMDVYVEAENFLHTSVAGIQSLEPDALSTQHSLGLLRDVHTAILTRQDRIVTAVAERDKRYKKTEIQPLYAAGNITKMKTVEKHFENAEKQSHIKSLRDKAGRVGELVSVAEEVIVHAVGIDQRQIDAIIAAMRELEDNSTDAELLHRAHETLTHLKSSSKALLKLFNDLEVRHNAAVLDAEIAQAKFEGQSVEKLEEEKAKGEEKFREEFERKVEVIEQDEAEVERLIGKKVVEGEKERRMKLALEEAKRRNGHA